jgi:hypothetical protein
MMERLPQRFCPPSELGNPQRTRVSTFPQRRRLRLSNWTQLLNPRKSNVSTDSRPEPVYDVSRWGRFQDSDEAAHYEFVCKTAGAPVHYCAEMFANDGTLLSTIMKALKRAMNCQ